MKIVKQLTVILLVSFLGEVLHALIPVAIPAGVYAMILMFAGLCCGVIRLDDVETAADGLLGAMQILFLPALVGLMDNYALLGRIWPACVILVLLGTALVMLTSQGAARLADRKREK